MCKNGLIWVKRSLHLFVQFHILVAHVEVKNNPKDKKFTLKKLKNKKALFAVGLLNVLVNVEII